jgi:hypothetical protein
MALLSVIEYNENRNMRGNMATKSHKLYCYVDETGQDTKGRFYIVVAIATTEPREQLYEALEAAEHESGKGKLKWSKNSTSKRDAYIAKTLQAGIRLHVYYQIFEGPELSYEMTTVYATASAINAFVLREQITDYKATIIIDGLPRSMQGRVGKLLRNAGIKTKSVRGERDEANPGVRLADAVAGLLRQAHQGNAHFTAIQEELERADTLERLP